MINYRKTLSSSGPKLTAVHQQVGSFDKDGNYLLEFDYNQDPELVMDILKYGSGVEVLAPAGLRKRVKDELSKALKNY